MRATVRRFTGKRSLTERSLATFVDLGLLEDVVIADTPPTATHLTIDGDELERRASVRAGERPRHFENARSRPYGLDA
jgi:hypothetical protein